MSHASLNLVSAHYIDKLFEEIKTLLNENQPTLKNFGFQGNFRHVAQRGFKHFSHIKYLSQGYQDESAIK